MRTRWNVRIAALVLTICPMTHTAEAQISDWTRRFSFSGLVGSVTVDHRQWQRLDLRPRMHMGPVEAAFDIELFLDEEGRIRDRGWDFSSRRAGIESVLRKIHYIQYGYPNDPARSVYFRIGALESVTLGNGLVMRRYRNTFGSPGTKRTGVDLQIQKFIWDGLMVRGVVNDLRDLADNAGPLVGGRASARTWGAVTLGGTVVVDTDQLSALPDSVRAGRDRDPFGMYAADVSLPIAQTLGVHVTLYGGVARSVATTDPGTGLFGPGISLIAGRFTARAEGRFTWGRFEADYFGAVYDQTRVLVDPVARTVTTRESAIRDVRLGGLYVDAEYQSRFVKLVASYQHLAGDGRSDRTLMGIASIQPAPMGVLEKVTVSEGYYEKHIRAGDTGDFFEGDPETRFGYRLGLKAAKAVSVIWEVEFSYEPDGVGGFEQRRTLNLETRFAL